MIVGTRGPAAFGVGRLLKKPKEENLSLGSPRGFWDGAELPGRMNSLSFTMACKHLWKMLTKCRETKNLGFL